MLDVGAERTRDRDSDSTNHAPTTQLTQPHDISTCTHGNLLNVDLCKSHAGELLLKLGKVRADELAGAAPGCPVVDNNRLGAVDLQLASFPVVD